MDAIRTWFFKFNAREQGYLLAVAIVVAVYILYMGAVKPLNGLRNEMVLRNVATQEVLSRVQGMASEIKALKASGGSQRSRNMNQLITSSANDVGIRPSRIQPNSRGETSIRFENVSFADLLRWLYRMEYGEGIAVVEVSVNQGDRGGLVKATVRLGRG